MTASILNDISWTEFLGNVDHTLYSFHKLGHRDYHYDWHLAHFQGLTPREAVSAADFEIRRYFEAGDQLSASYRESHEREQAFRRQHYGRP